MPDFQQPSQLDFTLRTMQSNFDAVQRQVGDISRLLQGFNPEQIAAFDLAGIPSCWNTLTQRAGSWQGIVVPSTPHPFLHINKSAGGPNVLISITAGTVTDLTNSGTLWDGYGGSNQITINDPVYGPVPFAVPVLIGGGPATRQPQLQLNSGATCCYLNATIDPTTGFITAMEIDADTGGGIPASTDTNWYTLLSDLTVTIVSSVASVAVFNDGAQSNLFFAICGITPLLDGTSYRVGT